MNFNPHAFSLRQLQYIVAVADLLSFNRAADECHVSQPSLSLQIAELERVLAIKIFERDAHRVPCLAAFESSGLLERRDLSAHLSFETPDERFDLRRIRRERDRLDHRGSSCRRLKPSRLSRPVPEMKATTPPISSLVVEAAGGGRA